MLDDYFTKFYGPAAEPMEAYFMAMEESMQAWNGCVSYGLQGVAGMKVVGPEFLTPEVMAKMTESLSEAEGLTAADETLAARVGMARQMHAEAEEALAALRDN